MLISYSILGNGTCFIPPEVDKFAQCKHPGLLGRSMLPDWMWSVVDFPWNAKTNRFSLGLFTVTGIGLIPSRTLDTYSEPQWSWSNCSSRPPLPGISKIWHYKRKTRKLRARAGLPELYDIDDLPDPAYDPNFVHVLTEQEQQDLHNRTCPIVMICATQF
jgi:hypothetical protein